MALAARLSAHFVQLQLQRKIQSKTAQLALTSWLAIKSPLIHRENNGFLLSVLINYDPDYVHPRKQSFLTTNSAPRCYCSPCTQLRHHTPAFPDSHSNLKPSILVTARPSQHIHCLTINTRISKETSRSIQTYTTPHGPTVSDPSDSPCQAPPEFANRHSMQPHLRVSNHVNRLQRNHTHPHLLQTFPCSPSLACPGVRK